MLPVCLGAADAVVVAGGARFGAHAALLAAHSGYFRAALAEREAERASEENPLYVPNVSAQQFWPLLAYMYTGYLELSPDNIYQVLLATHLLHMPRALELCRSFLAAGRANPALPPTLVKPIPSRKLPPFLSHGIFRPLCPDNSFAYRPLTEGIRQPSADPAFSIKPLPIGFPPENKESTSSPSRQISTRRESVGSPPIPATPAKNKKVQKMIPPERTPSRHSPEVPKPEENEQLKANRSQSDKIIVDIACCDGPVRFHRVLNDAYKSGNKTNRMTEATDSDDSYVEIEEDSRSREGTSFGNADAFNESLQKQMNENIRLNRERNENHPEESFDGAGERSANGSETSSKRQQETVYTCVYCNHTFKSQYCYQKHARRHLNPVSIDAVDGESPDSNCKIRKMPAAKSPIGLGPRREVKLLDMNVQYYPCKTCGSKFPSYYFVHKHRKMCHADELENMTETVKGNPSNEKKRKTSSTIVKEKNATERESNKTAEGTN